MQREHPQQKGSPVVTPSHEELLARIAKDYYLDNQSKVEIARTYGISRFQVARMLDEARALGIVKIEIRFPHSGEGIDAKALAKALGLKHIISIHTGSDDLEGRELLAQAAAKELMAAARPGATVGISWSRTLDLAARHVTELPRCDIVQLAGALPVAGSGNSLELIQRLGQLSGGSTWPVWAPLVVENAATAQSLARQPEIASALTKADSLDLAVVAIGAWAPGLSTVWDRVDNAVRLAAAQAGAVTECSGRLLDADGRPLATELDSRVLAVTVEQLRHTPQVIAVAQGAARAQAVLAAAKAGFITTLIADNDLVAALSELPGLETKEAAGE